MKQIKKILISFAIFLMLIIPVFSFAYKIGDPIVPPCDKSIVGQCTWGFREFMILIDNVITFIFKALVVPIAAVMFFYAGFKMVTSGGSAEARGQAKNIFSNAVIGLIVAVGAWLIIRTILSILGYDGAWIGFPK